MNSSSIRSIRAASRSGSRLVAAAALAAAGAALAAQIPTSAAPSPAMPARASAGSDQGPVLTLQQAIDAALADGFDMKIVMSTLDAARAQHAINLSKFGFGLTAGTASSSQNNYGYASSDADATDTKAAAGLKSLGAAAGVNQSVSGSLVLTQGTQSSTNPFTRVSLTATHNLPAQGGAAKVNIDNVIGVSIAQTLWDGYPGGQTRAAVQKSALTLQGKELAAVQGKAAAIAKAQQAYVTMLSAQRTLAVRKGIAEKQNAVLKQFQAIFDLKQASTVDLMTAQINARSAELDVASGSHDLSLARQRLATILGLAPDARFSVAETDDAALPAKTVEEAISTGLANRADAAQLALGKKSSSIDLVLARGSAQPGLSVSGGYSVAMSSTSADYNANLASLGLKVSMPVLDAGSAKGQIAAAKAQIALYDAQLEQLRRGIAADVRDAFEVVELQIARVELAKRNAELYGAKFEIAKAQNAAGAMSNQDYLAASVDAANYEAAYAAAKSTYLLSVLALRTAMGI